jgi:hypothetical protein
MGTCDKLVALKPEARHGDLSMVFRIADGRDVRVERSSGSGRWEFRDGILQAQRVLNTFHVLLEEVTKGISLPEVLRCSLLVC